MITDQIPILLTVEQLRDAVADDLSHANRLIIPATNVLYGSAVKSRQTPTGPKIVFELGENFDVGVPLPSAPQNNLPGATVEFVDTDGQKLKARTLLHTMDRAIITIHHPGPKKLDSPANRTLARAEVVKLRAATIAAIYRAMHGSVAWFPGRWIEPEEDYRTGAACEFTVGIGCPVLDDPKLVIYDFIIRAKMIARFVDRDYLVAEPQVPE
jgi:hypothetical protein